MSKQLILQDVETVKLLSEILSQSPKVTRYDHGDNKESWTIAVGFRDIEESFYKTLQEIQKLLEERIDEDNINNILLDIGEELRHIKYHIDDMKFYDYLNRDNSESSPKNI